MHEKSVLVIVLNYKGKEVLLPCLASVFRELGPLDQCLVVDNGGESVLIETMRKQFPRLRVLTPETNLGFAKGMNQGLRLAQEEGFEAAWILNNDTLVRPGTLAHLKKAADVHPGANLFSPVILTPEKKVWFAGGKINFWRMRTEHRESLPKTSAPFLTDFLTGCALFIPRAVLDTCGFLDERYFLYYEDAEYSQRVRSRLGTLWVVPEAVVIHGEVSEANPEKIYWLVRSGVEFFRRHSPFPLSLWVNSYLFLRQCKNRLDLILSNSSLARSVKRAYTDASTE